MLARLRIALPYAVVVFAGWLAVFVAPWHLSAGTHPVISDSYAIGFDNQIAMLGALLACAALFAVGLWRHREAGGGPLVLDAAPPRRERVSAWLVALLFVVSAATAVFFAWLAIKSYTYGEKNYFLDRLAYVLGGGIPYRDVEFTYGPLLIYLPVFVARLLAPLGVGPSGAYSLTQIAMYLTGVPLLAYCVDRLALTHRQRNALFAAVGVVVAWNETVGVNGLLLRFLMPAAALMLLHSIARRAGGRLRPLAVGGGVALAGICGLAVSPEVGVAVLVGAAVYVCALLPTDRRAALVGALGLPVAPLLAYAVLGDGAMRHLVGMAGGALNFPVVPGPPMLVLLGTAAGAAALLPRHVGPRDAGAPAALALAAAGAVMLVGALGRADASHAFCYGLTLALLAAALLAARSPRAFAAYAGVFCGVFLAAHLLMLVFDYGGMMVAAAARDGGIPDVSVARIAQGLDVDPETALAMRERARLAAAPDPRPFAPYAPLVAPLGFRDGLGLALGERGMLGSSYFRGTPYTPEQLAVQLGYLRRARHLIVPDAYAAALVTPPPTHASRPAGGDYGFLLMWPQQFAQVRRLPPLVEDVRMWIAARYRPVMSRDGYTVLERKE